MPFDTRGFLRDLRREVESHPAVNHTFLARLATTPFRREDYRVFGLQHYTLVGLFTHYLERLLLKGPDSESKSWIAKVLIDEYGEGSDGKDHAALYQSFLRACGATEADENNTLLDSRTVSFVRTHIAITRDQSFLTGLGALGPGHEWAIPRMFESLITGLRRTALTEEDILYFTLHVEQDADHAAWLEESLATLVKTASDAEQVRAGARMSLDARAKLWDGIQTQVVQWRQPRHSDRVRDLFSRLVPAFPTSNVLRRPEIRAWALAA